MIRIDSALCNGCGTCALVCPHGVLEIASRKANLLHRDRCIECGACQLNCAPGAMHVTKGTGCLVAIIKEDILRLQPEGCG